MRLLICTQAVDTEDPLLGFFHTWIERLAPSFESVDVICLKKGTYALPPNVRVYSLGKETAITKIRGFLRIKYAVRFLRLLFLLRTDAVFVHMNQEYVLLGGWWWRTTATPVFLWRNHAKGSFRTRIAALLSRMVFYTSPHAYVAKYRNAMQMPVGIDTERFAPRAASRSGVLILGRISAVKRVREMLAAAREALVLRPFKLQVVGSATPADVSYEKNVEADIACYPGTVERIAAVPNEKAAGFFSAADVLMNFTPPGSFDKVMFEAAACGALLLTTNAGLAGQVPDECVTTEADAPQAIVRLLSLPDAEKDLLRAALRERIVKQHSLELLTKKLVEAFRGAIAQPT